MNGTDANRFRFRDDSGEDGDRVVVDQRRGDVGPDGAGDVEDEPGDEDQPAAEGGGRVVGRGASTAIPRRYRRSCPVNGR